MELREVLSPDEIPSIDEPRFDSTYFGEDDDDVIVVSSAPARAYPVRLLNRHEIVNDRLDDGTPIAVTWCPLCGSAIVYDRVVDGRTLTFGVSGKLADDDLVMYDRETESEWKQSLGKGIDGPHEGDELTVRSATMTTWEVFRTEYPDGIVLQPPTEEHGLDETDYEDDPYESYAQGDGFGIAARMGNEPGRAWERSDLDPKTVVLGVQRGDAALGFPRPTVEAAGGVVHADVGSTSVVIFATDEALHSYRNPGYEFEPADDETFSADETTWNAATGAAADGRQLERVPSKRLYAFTWQDDHGPEAFYEH